MPSLSTIKQIALGEDLKKKKTLTGKKNGLLTLNTLSFSLAGIAVLFLFAFYFNNSVSLTWFFLSEALAFTLIPILARKGYENSSKFLLITYVDVGIIILSSVFGKDMLIQVFLIPACGLSVLLFDKENIRLRNIGIGVTILSYFVLDYIIFEKIYLTSDGSDILKWGILIAAFISTWMIFNKFSEFKELAEEESKKLLQKKEELNEELLQKKGELEEKVSQLKEAKKKVEQGSRAKTEFLSTISHEIRTPMNAIIGMTNLLSKDNPRPDQMEQLEILDFSSRTLLSLINDVLDFSKIESGRIEFEDVHFDLRFLLNGVLKSFQFHARKKGIDIELDIEGEFPEVLVGDSTRLTQILNNLMSNAVKFTEEGSVKLNVKALEYDDKTVTLQFNIIDTGVGIAEEKKEEIFESFTQERANTTRVFGGTGLGLTISKKLIQLQGGDIYLESEKDKGSVFTVELTYKVGDRSNVDRLQTLQWDEDKLEGVKVLVVEDNTVNQKVMERFLKKWDMQIEIAHNGKEALEKLKEEHFHIILMDLQMPVMDGYEATQEIRTLDDSRKRNVPIIALTAAALKEVKENVFASGMNDFITKPFNPNELRNKLEHFIMQEYDS